MSASIEVFRAADEDTVSIAATAASANVRILGDGLFQRPEINVRVYNGGTGIIYIRFGPTSAIAATVQSGSTRGSIPIAPGTVECFRIAIDQCFVAAITGTNGTIFFTPGFGA